MKKRTFIPLSVSIVVTLIFLSSPLIAVKALTDSQIDSVLDLLGSFGVDRNTVSEVENALRVGASVSKPSKYSEEFGKNLGLGSIGVDVKRLQRWLNGNGYKVADSGAGSLGNETDYFGERTRRALAGYQVDRGIEPASGYFGPKTRESINLNSRTAGVGIEGMDEPCEKDLEKEEEGVIEDRDEPKEERVSSDVLVQTVEVDRESYKDGEKIGITIKLKNPTEEEVEVRYRSGCQFDYSVGGYRFMDDAMCTQALTEVRIPAGKHHVWETVHDLSRNPLEQGGYTVVAGTVDTAQVSTSGVEIGPEGVVEIVILAEADSGKDDIKDFVDCLRSAGVVIYSSEFCPQCLDLYKSLGGKDMVSSIYVDCMEEGRRCYDEMLGTVIPEIQIEGDLYKGSHELKYIGNEVGCQF